MKDAPKKKKQKNRFKDFDKKSSEQEVDMMDAYTEKPPKEEVGSVLFVCLFVHLFFVKGKTLSQVEYPYVRRLPLRILHYSCRGSRDLKIPFFGVRVRVSYPYPYS